MGSPAQDAALGLYSEWALVLPAELAALDSPFERAILCCEIRLPRTEFEGIFIAYASGEVV